MNKTLMAAVVVLVSGTPLAFAATGATTGTALATRHCSYLDQQGRFQPESAKPVAEEKINSLCQQDRHKQSNTRHNGGGSSKKG
jgi:hypothetical protein